MKQEHLVEFLCAVCGAQGLTVSHHETERPQGELQCPACGHALHLLIGVPDHTEPIAV